MTYGAGALVAEFVQSFQQFPPRQRPASFSVDQIMEQFTKVHGSP
jgi:arylsulfatase